MSALATLSPNAPSAYTVDTVDSDYDDDEDAEYYSVFLTEDNSRQLKELVDYQMVVDAMDDDNPELEKAFREAIGEHCLVHRLARVADLSATLRAGLFETTGGFATDVHLLGDRLKLTAEAFDVHIPKGYLYAAMAFSLGVEALNIRARGKRNLSLKPKES